jgi:hypothetical protein
VVTKAFDRGSILIVVYTAFSMSMAEHVWSTVSPWRVVAVAGCGPDHVAADPLSPDPAVRLRGHREQNVAAVPVD